jgi:hypothetical protein
MVSVIATRSAQPSDRSANVWRQSATATATDTPPKPDPGGDGDAFGTLVRALTAQQQAGLVQNGDPQQLALYVWAVVHGIAMLALDGILRAASDIDTLTELAIANLWAGIGR